MRLTVIGTGYLGAVHAACMASLGHDVVGVDHDEAKVAMLSAGRAPFFEPDLNEIVRSGVANGNLRFTTSIQEAARFGDVHFVCVGTPQQADSSAADLSYVESACIGLARDARQGALIVGKSTVPVGTADRLVQLIGRHRPDADIELAWNPEFLREGFAVRDTISPDRIVVGVQSARAESILREVYAKAVQDGVPWISTDLRTAELVKVAANSFLATKISFINAMAEVCEAVGADVVTLAESLGHDSRIGARFLGAGLGFGGGCLPKDIRAFTARAEELGLAESVNFLKDVDAINLRRRQRTVDLVQTVLGDDLSGRRVAVLGAAFKPNSDDVRDSPALHVARVLAAAGADIRVHDPEASDNARLALPEADHTDDIEKALEGADVVLHLTEWDVYRSLDPAAVANLTRRRTIIDARNQLDLRAWHAAGWDCHALGRPSLHQ